MICVTGIHTNTKIVEDRLCEEESCLGFYSKTEANLPTAPAQKMKNQYGGSVRGRVRDRNTGYRKYFVKYVTGAVKKEFKTEFSKFRKENKKHAVLALRQRRT